MDENLLVTRDSHRYFATRRSTSTLKWSRVFRIFASACFIILMSQLLSSLTTVSSTSLTILSNESPESSYTSCRQANVETERKEENNNGNGMRSAEKFARFGMKYYTYQPRSGERSEPDNSMDTSSASSSPPLRHRARPTNRWFQNAILGGGDQPIVSYPYSLRMVSHGSGLYDEIQRDQMSRDSLASSSLSETDPSSSLSLSNIGVFMSLPTKESSELQVIMPWRPNLLITAVSRPKTRDQEEKEKQYYKESRPPLAGLQSNNSSPSSNDTEPSLPSSTFYPHQILSDDLLSVEIGWREKRLSLDSLTAPDIGRLTFPIVRGSPYITGIYSGGVTPALYTGHAILSVNDEDRTTRERASETSSSYWHSDKCQARDRHEMRLNSGHTVLAYLDRPACVRWDRNRIVFYQSEDDPSNTLGDWVIRVALLPALATPVLANSISILDTFHASIPHSGMISVHRSKSDDRDDGSDSTLRGDGGPPTSVLTFRWRTIDMRQNVISMVEKRSGNHVPTDPEDEIILHTQPRATHRHRGEGHHSSSYPCELLLLTLPHHSAHLINRNAVGLHFDSIKGQLTGQVGRVWRLRLHHLASSTRGRPDWNPVQSVHSASSEWRDAIRTSLDADAKLNISTEATDAYTFGKEAARMARLILIADELNQHAIANELRRRLQASLEPWLTGQNSNPLMYDVEWGGIVPKNGLNDPNADYGAAFYNDHHFHYGYLIYACAAILRDESQSAWGQKWKERILTLVRDIANPSALIEGVEGKDDELDLAKSPPSSYSFVSSDSYFTSLRHMDLFESHSWANGLLESPNGRNQESSTEAINAYYAIALLGLAYGDDSMQYLGEVLTAVELTGVHHYWHSSSQRSVYPHDFSRTKMVGMVWSDKVVHETWFAGGLAYVHCINILPITPITEWVLPYDYVREQYPVLESNLPLSRPRMDDVWLGFVHADLAIIDPIQAWERTMNLTRFDGGSSRTNLLHWIATRPISNTGALSHQQ